MTKPTDTNRRILLASRPIGTPLAEDFRIEDAPMPEPSEGEVLLKILYLSLDPYMRGRMSAARSYAAPVEVGAVMEGGTVGQVIQSRKPHGTGHADQRGQASLNICRTRRIVITLSSS